MYSLRPLGRDDLELVLTWRNSDRVRSCMIYQKTIEWKDHLCWFEKLDKNFNKYYIYYNKEIAVGLVNLKNIDVSNQICEAGMYCGNPDYINHMINILAPMRIYMLAFERLKMQKIWAKILTKNSVARKLNKRIGFEDICDHGEMIDVCLSIDNFEDALHVFGRRVASVMLFE